MKYSYLIMLTITITLAAVRLTLLWSEHIEPRYELKHIDGYTMVIPVGAQK